MKKRKKLVLSIAFIAVLCMNIVAVAVMLIAVDEFKRLVDTSTQDHVVDNMDSFMMNIESFIGDATKASASLAEYDVFISAMESGDETAIYNAVDNFYKITSLKTDNITIIGTDGNVIMRYYSDKKGDSMASNTCVKSALSGTALSSVTTGSAIPLGARAAAPVRGSDGKVIGAVSITFSFEDNDVVDNQKGSGTSEFTIFVGDERLTTTLKNDKGERAVGTKMSDAVKKTVIDEGQDYIGDAEI